MTLERFVRKRPVVASRMESCRDVAVKMREAHVGSVVIVEGDRPVGIVTDRDLVSRLLAQGLNPELAIQEVMTPKPFVAKVGDGLDSVVFAMRRHGVRRIPIVADDGRLLGLVSLDDIYVLLSAELSSTAQAVTDNRGP